MKSRRARRFRETFAALPESVRLHALDAYSTFAADPFHPGLQFKLIDPETPRGRCESDVRVERSPGEGAKTSLGSGSELTLSTTNSFAVDKPKAGPLDERACFVVGLKDS